MKVKNWISAGTAAVLLCTGLTGCSAAETYTDYVQAVLDCTYKGDTAKYMEMTEATQDEANAVYDDEVAYVCSAIYYNYSVMEDMITDDTKEGYEALSKDIMNKLKYTVNKAERSGDTYHITVVSEPIDFWDISMDAVADLYDNEFAERFAAFSDETEEEAAADEAYVALEAEWGEEVLTLISGYVEQISYKTAQETILAIKEDDEEYGVDDKLWYDIDDLLLDMDSNTPAE